MSRIVKTIIFGGAFDPPTRAHIAIFEKIQDYIARNTTNEDYILKILISCNDEKVYNTSFEDRKAMVEKAFANEKKFDYDIVMQEARMKDTIEKTLGILLEDAVIVVGMDQAINIANDKWHYSQMLRDKCSFLVFDRGCGKSMFDKIAGRFKRIRKLEFSADEYHQDILSVSSSKAREEFESKPFVACETVATLVYLSYIPEIFKIVTEEVLTYIYTHGLYHQFNKPTYQAEEEEFIKNYKKEAKEKGWGEPSCTATILVYNASEEVLLIRRKGYPYKGHWALPGGFFELKDDSLEATAARELEEETGLHYIGDMFKQIKVYSHMFDPRMRIIDTAFCIGIPDELQETIMAADDAAEARWFPMYKLPHMAFHHAQIVYDFMSSNNNPFKK